MRAAVEPSRRARLALRIPALIRAAMVIPATALPWIVLAAIAVPWGVATPTEGPEHSRGKRTRGGKTETTRTAEARPDFEGLAARQAEETIADRRWLHEHPELSMREHRTQEWIRRRLAAIPGINFVDGEWGTGLVALLRGGKPGPLVAWRADIDALPITEETGLPYASTAVDTLNDRQVGVMHACGHDIHAAVLLGTARLLSETRAEMPGSVLFLVQPGEEVGEGAELLIRGGVLEKSGSPVAIFGIHDHPTLLSGQVGYCPGWATANVDDFRIKVLGKGGHGAYPHRTVDPVLIAAQIVIGLQSIRSREVDTSERAVITVGSIRGGNTSNIIPEEVELRGTVRSLDPQVREQIREAVLRTAKGIAQAAGAPEPEIRYRYGTPSLYNHPDEVERAARVLRRVAGEDQVIRYEPGMGGEDFAYYTQKIPGFMWRLGVARPGEHQNLHSPDFNPDEAAIPLGVRLAAEVLWERLEAEE